MSVSVVVLAVAVVGAFFINKMAAALLTRFLPGGWWLKPVRALVGWGLGILYIYFAGYYIMGKTTPLSFALVVALTPWVVYLAWKIASKSKMIEE